MADEYEPTPNEVAAYVERMLSSLEEITTGTPGLTSLREQLRLARLFAERHGTAQPLDKGSASRAEAVADIARDLLALAARAEQSGFAMLAYLIGVAHEEAGARSRAAT